MESDLAAQARKFLAKLEEGSLSGNPDEFKAFSRLVNDSMRNPPTCRKVQACLDERMAKIALDSGKPGRNAMLPRKVHIETLELMKFSTGNRSPQLTERMKIFLKAIADLPKEAAREKIRRFA